MPYIVGIVYMGVSTFWPGEVLRENGPDDIDPKEMLLDVHRYEIDVMYSRPEDGFTKLRRSGRERNYRAFSARPAW